MRQLKKDFGVNIYELLAFVQKSGASDLHISTDQPPMLRIHGDMKRINHPAIPKKECLGMITQIMDADQKEKYERNLELDFSIDLETVRFRVNAFFQMKGPAAVFRAIPVKILSFEDLGLPKVLTSVCSYERGLVLVTGPTGSGKSTTLAAMIDFVNRTRQAHIITIEDPDIILVGEMRDIETIRLALTAAETGHLVFGTLHTCSAPKTIDRIIDVFPADEKGAVQTMLAESLRAVVSQTLLKRKDGSGRCAAHEILIAVPAVKNLIREKKIYQIPSVMQTGQKFGMQLIDQSLKDLMAKGIVDREEAITKATNPENFFPTIGTIFDANARDLKGCPVPQEALN
jgi:twitching motility protein PilT